MILYSAGRTAIIQDLKSNEQKYFVRHKKEIRCICINDNKTLIATGENESKIIDNDNTSTVRIWYSKTLNEQGNIILPFKGVTTLSFSLDDKYLVCGCIDEEHKVVLIDVEKKILITQKNASKRKILHIAFKSNNEFATVGLYHYTFWIINENQLISKEYTNTLENFDIRIGIISVMGENFVTGNSEGFITLWKDQVNLKMKKCHKSQIDSLYSDNKLIISGGRDKTLTILDTDLTILKKIYLDFNQNVINYSPKSIDVLYEETEERKINKILIGTSSGEILELIFEKNILDDKKPTETIYNYSHFSFNPKELCEITSISYWKKLNMFVTTSEDKTIRFWDLNNKTQYNFIKINEDIKPTAASFSIKEDIFAVGFNNGIIRFYLTTDFHMEREIKGGNGSINAIKYSKDDDLIAYTTQDEKGNNVIEIYKTNTFYHYGTLKGAQTKINGLDWSDDCKYIASFSHEGECRIFSVYDKYMISDYSLVDFKEWNSWTLAYGWPLKGYYNSKEGETPIYACERFKLDNEEKYVIAIGDYHGNVKLYKYPITNKDQRYITNIIGHGNKITNVRFGKIENKNILFTSSSDECLIAWQIEQV